MTSFSDVAGQHVVSDVQDAYDDFEQLITEWQNHTDAVDQQTPKVQYAYADGSSNHTRLQAVIYPDSDDPTTLDGNGTDGIYDRVEKLPKSCSASKENEPRTGWHNK